jgi:DNA-binding transcriptional LysR family regulator
MTLEQLRIFVAVAQRLHMTRAAEHLNITQSAASAAIAALEARHGVRLFNRVGRGLELSEAGRVFHPQAEAVLAKAQGASDALADLAGLKLGAIRFAASQTVASYWLPGRMAAFANAYPTITCSLIVANSQQVALAVVDGESDLGIVEGPVREDRLIQREVGGDRLSLYVSPTHPLASLEEVAPEDLTQAKWVLREPGSGTRSELEASLARRGVDLRALDILLELPSNEAVLAAAASGGLVTGVSDLAAAPHLAAGRLGRAAFELSARAFTLLLHRDRQPSQAVAAFLSRL